MLFESTQKRANTREGTFIVDRNRIIIDFLLPSSLSLFLFPSRENNEPNEKEGGRKSEEKNGKTFMTSRFTLTEEEKDVPSYSGVLF